MTSLTSTILLTSTLLLMADRPVLADSSPAPAPGVPIELAQARRARIESLRYRLSFEVPPTPADRVRGRNAIDLTLGDASAPLVVDFDAPPEAVTSVTVNGHAATPDVRNGHVIVPPAHLTRGANVVDIAFVAGDGPLNRGDDFLYTLFVPARAHRAFPCFDQPDLKARVALTLDVPAGWEAVANGAPSGRDERDGRVRLTFAETPPLSTYLVAFAAGKLQVELAERDGRTFRMFHRETDAAKLQRNRDAVFDLHAGALAWLERYTGIPYPWGKFDFFLVPAFQFGGMEHAGAIFYNAPALLLDESATQAQLLGRASLIAHETAHMWFGDLVTMRWFDDVWMKEVFANFFAAKIVNPAFPAIDHDLRFLLAHYPAAYDVDRTAGTHAVRQPLDNLDAAGTLYGPIIYQKAPIAIRQLERRIGEERFRDGMREYLGRHAFGNASWSDLIALLDARTGDDLAGWSRIWIEDAGRPTVRTKVITDDSGRVLSAALVQSDPQGRARLWPQSIQVLVDEGTGLRTIDLRLDAPRVELPGLAGAARPQLILPTAAGLGYGDFVLDATTRATLVAGVQDLPDALSRGAAYVTLWEDVLQRRLTPQEWMALADRALARETEEQNLSRLIGYTSTAFWRFLPADRRAAIAPELEARLRAGLDRASTRTAKAAWFQGLSRVATTRETVAWLERMWRREVKIEGLPLAEPDETSLALELAVREVASWRDVLARQQERITNPDRQARFAFVRPALDADPDVRDRFFASLADLANRRREPWVLEALSYLHHPLRAARSARYVQPGLEMLEEIRRTGDIFFPKRWLEATLGGHSSRAVASTVEAFLAAGPDYPMRLRRIVLQSADELTRAAALTSPDAQ